MELPSQFSEQIAFNTTPKVEEHMLVGMDKSTHEESLSQGLQINNKQTKMAVSFQLVITVSLKLLKKNLKLYSAKLITDKDGFIQI